MTDASPPPRNAPDDELAGRKLRNTLGSFLTGVTILTAWDQEGGLRGLTANSFTSVSLDPPLVIVCVSKRAGSYDAFSATEHFGVNILAEDQVEIAGRFAGPHKDKFAGIRLRDGLPAPVLEASPAWLVCSVHSSETFGDHVVLVGEVEAHESRAHRPLGFFQGRFLSLAPTEPGATGSHQIRWLAEVEGGVVLTKRSDGRWSLPAGAPGRLRLDDDSLRTLGSMALGGTEIGLPLLFSIYDDPASGDLILVYRVPVAAAPANGNGLAFHAGDDIPWSELDSPETGDLLRRYLHEREADQFGIYAGSAGGGTVTTLESGFDWNTYLKRLSS